MNRVFGAISYNPFKTEAGKAALMSTSRCAIFPCGSELFSRLMIHLIITYTM